MQRPNKDAPIRADVLYLFFFSIITLIITAIIPKLKPEINCKKYNLYLKVRFRVSSVNDETIIIIMYENIAATRGDINHDINIMNNLSQFSILKPVTTIPAPNRDPITVCVPDIGIEYKDEVMMKIKDAKQTPNIIL